MPGKKKAKSVRIHRDNIHHRITKCQVQSVMEMQAFSGKQLLGQRFGHVSMAIITGPKAGLEVSFHTWG